MLYQIRPLAEHAAAHAEIIPEWFPQSQAAYILQTKDRRKRAEKIAAYELLVTMLRANGFGYELPELVYNEQGKPHFRNYPNLHFNISHCAKAVAVVLHSHPVGIDIECRRRVSRELMAYVCNQAELSTVAAAPDPELAFIRLWTQKEAMVKCMGGSIGQHLQDILCQHPELHLFTTPIFNGSGFVSICWQY